MNRALLYDWECRHVHHRTDEDLGFWLELATSVPGPCLELACGTGRVTWPLAHAGVEIVGLDNDPDMLVFAAAHPAEATANNGSRPPCFVIADMRRFAFARRFGSIIVPYNSLQLLTGDDDVLACLAVAAEHLAGDGRLGVEVTDFQVGATLNDVPTQLIHSDGTLELTGSLHHDFVHRTSRYHRRFCHQTGTLEDDVILRSMSRDELATALNHAGLTPERWFEADTTTRVIASRSPV